jgi:uncharacterized spore protein YtfJ
MSGESTVEERAAQTAAEAPQSRRRAAIDEVLAGLADRIGGRLVASTVFGTPVERGGVTVVPVAAARFGFGAGTGSGPEGQGEGGGGGGGGVIMPTGYIELREDRSRFVPVVHPARMALLALGLAALALVAVERVRKS